MRSFCQSRVYLCFDDKLVLNRLILNSKKIVKTEFTNMVTIPFDEKIKNQNNFELQTDFSWELVCSLHFAQQFEKHKRQVMDSAELHHTHFS